MQVGDLVRPVERKGWDSGTESWIGLVRAIYLDDLTGTEVATVFWNRKEFQSEEEYCYQLEVINESR